MKNVLMLYVTIALILASCNKRKEKCEGGSSVNIRFEMPFTISPNTDTIQLGDTLWVESIFDANVTNVHNNKKYNVGGVDFSIFITIQDLMLQNVVPIRDFSVVNSSGIEPPNEHPENTLFIVHEYNNGQCYWKRGFIMHRRGLFLLSTITDMGNFSLNAKVTECPEEWIGILFRMNDGKNNYHLIQYSSDENARGWAEDGFVKSGNYAFVVN